jgi:WD40 repeat protein
MSAMSFDFSGRRLLIGGQDGHLSMWNFNNGQQLKEFRGFGQVLLSLYSLIFKGYVPVYIFSLPFLSLLGGI